jgi:hypothetical protein
MGFACVLILFVSTGARIVEGEWSSHHGCSQTRMTFVSAGKLSQLLLWPVWF